MRRAAILLLALLVSAAGPGPQDPVRPDAAPPRQDPIVREVVVPLEQGRLDVVDLVRALLDAYGLDARELRMRSRTIDLRGVRGHLLLLGARRILLDTVSFRRSLDDDALTVTIDRERAREVRRALRARIAKLAGHLTGEDVLERTYVLEQPDAPDSGRTLVVLVHGVESSPAVFADLQTFLGGRPEPPMTATFAYPNDESCEKVAAALGRELRALGADRRVAIVAHSMGGLVARTMLEDPELDPGNVRTLILIGTPNHGSDLAGFRFALESAHLIHGEDGELRYGHALLEGLRSNLLDGLGEAGGDLLPGSVFLTRLAARPRNPTVTYHQVLGTRAPLSRAQLDALGARTAALLDRTTAARLVRPRVERWFAELDELVDGQGDGAVSVASGQLDGVDTVLVPLDHVGLIRLRGILTRTVRAEDHPVFTAVAGWLADDDRR